MLFPFPNFINWTKCSPVSLHSVFPSIPSADPGKRQLMYNTHNKRTSPESDVIQSPAIRGRSSPNSICHQRVHWSSKALEFPNSLDKGKKLCRLGVRSSWLLIFVQTGYLKYLRPSCGIFWTEWEERNSSPAVKILLFIFEFYLFLFNFFKKIEYNAFNRP